MSHFKVSPEKVDAFVAKGKLFVPPLDALIADGTIVAYGIESDYLHVPGTTNVSFWYTAANFAALEKAEQALDVFTTKNAQVLTDIFTMSDLSAHRDTIVRSPVMVMKPSSACSPKFGMMTREQVKNGKVREDVALFKKYSKADMDALVNSGVICGYGYDVESFHSAAPGQTARWVYLPSLASIDKLRAAANAAWEKLSEPEKKLLEAFDDANLDPAAHRDGLTTVVAYKSK
jgi:hypothetical protein